jgi:hypothetical protein
VFFTLCKNADKLEVLSLKPGFTLTYETNIPRMVRICIN